MKNLARNEPVMIGATVISLVLAALIVAGKITLDDVSHFVAVFAAVLAIVGPIAAGLVVRSKVAPVKKP